MTPTRMASARDRLVRDMVADYDTLTSEQRALLDESIAVDGDTFVIAPPQGAHAEISADRKTAIYTRGATRIELLSMQDLQCEVPPLNCR